MIFSKWRNKGAFIVGDLFITICLFSPLCSGQNIQIITQELYWWPSDCCWAPSLPVALLQVLSEYQCDNKLGWVNFIMWWTEDGTAAVIFWKQVCDVLGISNTPSLVWGRYQLRTYTRRRPRNEKHKQRKVLAKQRWSVKTAVAPRASERYIPSKLSVRRIISIRPSIHPS